MAGVVGWWDEDPGDRMDELMGMTGEEAAQAVEKSVEETYTGDKSPFHDLDEQVLSQLKEGGAEQHLKDLDAVEAEPLTKEKLQSAALKIFASPSGNTSTSTATKFEVIPTAGSYTGMLTVTGANTEPITYHLDYVNLTGQAHRKFQEYQKAFEKVTAALDQLTPKLLGLPSKEYKGIKKELELIARVMVEAQEKGLR